VDSSDVDRPAGVEPPTDVDRDRDWADTHVDDNRPGANGDNEAGAGQVRAADSAERAEPVGDTIGQVTSEPFRHPVTGGLFDSPVTPGTGWPGDPATTRTPVARTELH
jgi:hypothetical protein